MAKTYASLIVGGGFSGLICAEILANEMGGENVIILEKNDRVGKKILATGNGRGNITNLDLTCEKYHSINGADISILLEKYGNKSIISHINPKYTEEELLKAIVGVEEKCFIAQEKETYEI